MEPFYMEKFITSDVNFLKNKLNWWKRTSARFEYMMSDIPIKYTYGSGEFKRTYESMPFESFVKSTMMLLNNKFNTEYDICFLNRYDNEKMALGWHADDSPEIDIDHSIAVVSIGAEREIWVKEKGFKGNIPDDNKYKLTDGSLFIMPAGFQKKYLHKIPKSDRPCGTRISLTYRKYKKS